MKIHIADLKDLLDFIVDNFSIHYEDFGKDEYKAYRKRRIVGFVRFDKKEIFFDKDIHDDVEELTWTHEALSIYYYHILKIIRHDDEIEKEARALCRDVNISALIRKHIDSVRTLFD